MTFYCILLISVVIIGMTLAYLSISESALDSSNYTNFLTNSNTAASYLQDQTVISHDWVSSTSTNNQFFMQVYDNGTPLSITSRKLSEDSQTIIEFIKDKAETEYNLPFEYPFEKQKKKVQINFRIEEKGKKYYACVFAVPKENGSLNIIFYQPLSVYRGALLKQRVLFFFIDVVAILILSLASWIFTGKLIEPIEKSKKQQTQFIASASHELRTPLAVILSNLSAMKKGTPNEAKYFASSIQSEGERMARLINDMLELANADNHNWSIKLAPLELDTLLLDTWEKYEPLAKEKGQTLQIILPDQILPQGQYDKTRLEQVLSILIDNSMAYTPKSGTIILSVEATKDKQILRVEDNGPGIPPKEREAIFQRFYRCDTSHTKKEHFGLGLSIAKEIIKLHQGNIYVEESKYGGAAFIIEFPIK